MAYAQQSDLDWLSSATKFAESYAERDAPAPHLVIGWIERIVATLALGRGMPIIEHVFGVLPTLRAFEGRAHNAAALEALRRGKMLAGLALFTPTPEFSWIAAAVPRMTRGDQSILTGEVRIGGVPSDWNVLLTNDIEQPELYRLALIANNQSGVTRARCKGSAQTADQQGDWLILKGVVVEPSFLSNPVALSPGATYWQTLDDYAGVFALAVALYASQAVKAARAALRLASHGGKLFNISQVLAMGTTELEVQIQFAEAAARTYFRSEPPRSPGLVLAAASARLLAEATQRVRHIAELVGTESDPPLDELSSSLSGKLFGGVLLIESEAARTLGI